MDMRARVGRWTQADDVETSILYGDTLTTAIKSLSGEVSGGIYNLASESVNLPKFIISNYGWNGEVVPAHSLGRTPSTVLDTSKAKVAGLL